MIDDIDKLLQVWGDCFNCGKDLTSDMVEDKDWFHCQGHGESYPICKECMEKEGEAK